MKKGGLKIAHLKNQKEKIIVVNFDWIIENHKVATQVFAMDTLLILGKKYDWVHNELKLILEKNTSSGSAGYQAHAKKILKETKDEVRIASLNYELAIMNNELNREKNADRHKKKALELYKKF